MAAQTGLEGLRRQLRLVVQHREGHGDARVAQRRASRFDALVVFVSSFLFPCFLLLFSPPPLFFFLPVANERDKGPDKGAWSFSGFHTTGGPPSLIGFYVACRLRKRSDAQFESQPVGWQPDLNRFWSQPLCTGANRD